MPILQGLLLQAKGEVKRVKLLDTKEKNEINLESLQTIIKKKTPLTELGTQTWNDMNLSLFGQKSGKAGTENQHELPAPLNGDTTQGDILLIASQKENTWTNPIDFKPEQQEKFQSSAFGNEDDQGSEDESSEEDEESEEEEEIEKEVEEEIIASSKKKAAVEDGVPEDEDDKEVEDEEEEEEEDEILDDGEVDGDGDGEILEEDEVVPAKRATKKKSSKTSSSAAQNTGQAKQQNLFLRAGFTEIEVARPIPKEGRENTVRFHGLTTLQKRLNSQFSAHELEKLELVILTQSLKDAQNKGVLRHFDNPLFEMCQMCAFRRLLSNLDPASYVKNSHLLTKIRQGDIQIEHLSEMTGMDYAPQLYSGLRDRMLLREQQQLEGNKAMTTDVFKCGRCHKRETTQYELQTRSADEPMTKFITCVNCGNHWRM